MKLKIAVLQKRSLDRQYEKSAGIIIEKMEEAAENKADILLLPEVFLTGYELPMTNEEAVSEDCPYIRQVCDAAKRLHLGGGAHCDDKGHRKAAKFSIRNQ